jgi:hypothetical protein
MNYLTITGKSNVLPNNKAWGLFSNGIQIEFGEFGDWVKVFNENKAQSILWLVFLKNIISLDGLLDKDSSSIKNDLDIILQTFVSHLNVVQTPSLGDFSTSHTETVISQAPCHSQ